MLSTTAEFLRFSTKGIGNFSNTWNKIIKRIPNCNKHKKDEREKGGIPYTTVKCHCDTICGNKTIHFQQGRAEKQKKPQKIACGCPGCQKIYLLDGRRRQRHRNICPYRNFTFLEANTDGIDQPAMPEDTSNNVSKTENDYRFDYACCVLRKGLMDWCREDAAKENDGDRLVRMWRFDLLRYSLTYHTKYRILAFKLLAQFMALLPPKLAHELRYNRCANVHGGKGGNVPGDLALEFMNMRAQDALSALHGNLTSASIQRCGPSLQQPCIILYQRTGSVF